jgi:DNA-directed RNA polymerase sigma subunit (sigma70/sigma32)
MIHREAERAILNYIKRESGVYYTHICTLENAVKMHSGYNEEYAETNVLRSTLETLFSSNSKPKVNGGTEGNTLFTTSEAVALKGYYLNGDTDEEIAISLGVSKSRVSQIRHKGLRRLRHPNRSRKIKDWYGETL